MSEDEVTIRIIKTENNKVVGMQTVRQSAASRNRRKKPEPVISVHLGVPPYGTPEFYAFMRALNHELNS